MAIVSGVETGWGIAFSELDPRHQQIRAEALALAKTGVEILYQVGHLPPPAIDRLTSSAGILELLGIRRGMYLGQHAHKHRANPELAVEISASRALEQVYEGWMNVKKLEWLSQEFITDGTIDDINDRRHEKEFQVKIAIFPALVETIRGRSEIFNALNTNIRSLT